MTNPFDAAISPLFKNTFNQAIDALLSSTALSVPCILTYATPNISLCGNCLYDPISQRSLNKYNQTGPAPFANNSICPVCNGYGTIDTAKTEIVYLGVIFDSKYWFKWSSNSINIADGSVQTICNISLLPKIKNAQNMTMDKNISAYGDYTYVTAGDPQPAGLGDNRYIITMWSRS